MDDCLHCHLRLAIDLWSRDHPGTQVSEVIANLTSVTGELIGRHHDAADHQLLAERVTHGLITVAAQVAMSKRAEDAGFGGLHGWA